MLISANDIVSKGIISKELDNILLSINEALIDRTFEYHTSYLPFIGKRKYFQVTIYSASCRSVVYLEELKKVVRKCGWTTATIDRIPEDDLFGSHAKFAYVIKLYFTEEPSPILIDKKTSPSINAF